MDWKGEILDWVTKGYIGEVSSDIAITETEDIAKYVMRNGIATPREVLNWLELIDLALILSKYTR